jgi:Icc-related predicted phosphoesterase
MHRKLELPEADLLIHAGDFTFLGELKAVEDFNDWLGEIASKYKYGAVVIAGNHELTFDPEHKKYISDTKHLLTNCRYLEHEVIEINGFKIFGSPWTPWFHGWAFNYDRAQAFRYWEAVPLDTHILITHGPPLAILDKPHPPDGESVGCFDLGTYVNKVKPQVHVFGHIHGSYGIRVHNAITYVNASVLNESYSLVNSPIVIELDDPNGGEGKV